LSEEKFDYLRTHLLAKFAHEVRSPAGVAWSALTELEESLAHDPEQQRMLLIARRSLRRLLCFADRLSMAAELERGPLALQLGPVSLRELVVRMAEEASEVVARKGVVFELEPSDSSDIEADERWLGASILELIANALRHARGRVRARLTVSDTSATILLEDDGRGFPEGFVLAGRERFSPAGVVGGVGFSLCMVNDVAVAHGGRLFGGASTLPPQPGGVSGAAVSIEVPVRRPNGT
jgi:signal transduction histidine kinase